MDPYDRLNSDLALTVCHTTDCLREGVVDRVEWERIVSGVVDTYERALRAHITGRKDPDRDAMRLGYSSGSARDT